MRHRLLMGVVLAVLAACTTAGPSTTTEPSVPTTTGPTATTTQPIAGEHDLVVYLLADPAVGELGPYLVPVHRTWVGETAEECAMEALLAGYTFSEVDLGLGSAVPFETKLLGVEIEEPGALVDLNRAFESGGGTASVHGRLGQLVYTVTQFEGVDQVELMLDGEAVTVFSGEGIEISSPLTRDGFADLLAPVHVEYPAWEQEVKLPFTLRGSVLSVDGGFTWDLVDWDGRVLGSGGVSILDAAGTRVAFDALIEADVSEVLRDPGRPFDGALIVQVGTADGVEPFVLEIPLRFSELR